MQSRRRAPTRRGHLWQAGQVVVLAALLMPVMLAMLGLSIDLGLGMATRRLAQTMADGGAFGGTVLIQDTIALPGMYTEKDVYNSIYDTIQQSAVPHTVNLYDPSQAQPLNTVGTVDLWAQFIDSSNTSYGYLTNTTAAIPSSATGLRVSASWPQRTYFGAAVGWQTYNVSAVGAYVLATRYYTQAPVVPFTVWWDPPYGSCNTGKSPCTTDAAVNAASTEGTSLCNPSAIALPCPAFPLNAQTGSDPNTLWQTWGPTKGTVVVFYSNQFKSDAGISNGSLPTQLDPDYGTALSPINSNDFKGYWGGTGSQLTCNGSWVDASGGNGSTGNNAMTAIQTMLTLDPSNSNIGYALFAVADEAYKSGDVYIHVYNWIPLQVDMTQFTTQNSNGPWYGTVMNAMPFIPGMQTTSCGSGTIASPTPVAFQ